MTKRKAIKALMELKKKLDDETFAFDSSWVIQADSYLSQMIGVEDVLYMQFKNVAISVNYQSQQIKFGEQSILGYRKQFLNILDSTIEKINHTGLKDNGKINFLSTVKNEYLIGAFSFAIPALFTIGTLWGKYLSDTQNIELKRQVKELQDNISKLNIRPIIQNPQAKPSNKGK